MVRDALAALDASGFSPGLDSVALPLALLAGGRFERVRSMIFAFTDPAVLSLVTARYVSWSGDVAIASAVWDRAVALLDSPAPASDDETVIRLAACTELERTATDLGKAADAARFKAAVTPLRNALAGRTLSESTRRLATIAGIGRRPAFDTGQTPALAILGLVHAILGLEPDATRGRIRLQPRLPSGWRRLDAPQFRFADGLVSIDIRRDEAQSSYAVAQPAGAIPFTALLEPITDLVVDRVTVDGLSASLNPRVHDDAILVPVQLVLDETRTLVIHHVLT